MNLCDNCKRLAELDYAISTLKRLYDEAHPCHKDAHFCDKDELKAYYLEINRISKENKEIRVSR